MSTRRAAPDSLLSQNRYMSSPDYAELRGVSGSAVTAKASILASERKRSLILFLQALSLEKGGMRVNVAEPLLKMFPVRVGTRTMRRDKIKAGMELTQGQAEAIILELDPARYCDFLLQRACDLEEGKIPEPISETRADSYLARCYNLDALAAFLIDLCINPRLLIPEPGQCVEDEMDILRDLAREKLAAAAKRNAGQAFMDHRVAPQLSLAVRDGKSRSVAEMDSAMEQHGLERSEFCNAEVPYFYDICGALYEFQRRHATTAESACARTNAARTILSTLKDGLRARKMVLIEAESDSGKSTAARTFCRMNQGAARYVTLQGITTKTAFFRAIARGLGLPSTYALNATDMQARIEDMLQRSGLMLILDESQYCFSQGSRIYSRPEIVDWIYTALCNHDVPVALIASPLFSRRMAQAARQVDWNFTQFERRIFRRPEVPLKPTLRDIELVARYHLPEADANTIKFLCGQAQEGFTPLTMLVNTITDARLMAEDAGRTEITLADLRRAANEHRVPTELQNRRAHEMAKAGKPGRRRSALVMQARGSDAAEQPPDEGGENNFTERSRSVAAPKTMPTRETGTALLEA